MAESSAGVAEAAPESGQTPARIAPKLAVESPAWPPVLPGGERLVRPVAALALTFAVIYIVWRWVFTLNPAALWFAVPLVLAETYGVATSFFMTFTAWRLQRRSAPHAPEGLSVDVFVTTYDEPLTVIRKTALAAREIRYPHSTWILDDGRRHEIRALAEDLGVGYIRRETNEHAKAGNLNNALRHTSGEYILQLDADHVPLPQILDRLLGFMTDEGVGFVQSPQDFYNTDAFTYEVNETARRIWEDQQLFFRVIQPGKDRMGAAFFVGSCAVIRRRALEDIGGFATSTITEDIETSMLLHSNGWKSVFYGETLAYGLAPGSAAAFHVQHLRWGQGAMQALRRYSVLTRPGLSIAQRIGYFDSLTTYLGGFQRLVFYLAPPLFFLTGAFPVRAGALQFAAIFVPYLALQMLSFKMLARGHGSLLLADRYGMAKFFTHIMAVTGYFTRGRLRFRVTPKGLTDVPFRTYAPQLMLAILTVGALAWGVFATVTGRASYAVPGWGSLAFWVNFVFAAWNVVVAVFIIDMSLRLRQKRQDHRYREEVPVRLDVLRQGRGVRRRLVGVSEDLNPTGVAVRTMEPIPKGDWVDVELPLSTGAVRLKGRVVHHREEETRYGAVHLHGIEFTALPWQDRDAIELHCAHHVTPMRRQLYREAALGRRSLQWLRDARRAPRNAVRMPARVTLVDDGADLDLGLGLWEDTSASGARIVLEEPVPKDARLRVEMAGTDYVMEGDVVFVRSLETSAGTRFLIGLRRDAAAPTRAPRRLAAASEPLRAVASAVAGHGSSIAARVGSAASWSAATARDAATRGAAAARQLTQRSGSPPAPQPDVAARAEARNAMAEPAAHAPAMAAAEPQQHETLVPAPAGPIDHDDELQREDPRMNSPVQPQPASADTQQQTPAFLSVFGGRARMHGRFEIEDSVEIRCNMSGELVVGGRLIIEDGGTVEATVQTADAVIRGVFDGDLVASGIVYIASSGRVTGSITTEELIIDRGGFFSGSVSRSGEDATSAPAPARRPSESLQPSAPG